MAVEQPKVTVASNVKSMIGSKRISVLIISVFSKFQRWLLLDTETRRRGDTVKTFSLRQAASSRPIDYQLPSADDMRGTFRYSGSVTSSA